MMAKNPSLHPLFYRCLLLLLHSRVVEYSFQWEETCTSLFYTFVISQEDKEVFLFLFSNVFSPECTSNFSWNAAFPFPGQTVLTAPSVAAGQAVSFQSGELHCPRKVDSLPLWVTGAGPYFGWPELVQDYSSTLRMVGILSSSWLNSGELPSTLLLGCFIWNSRCCSGCQHRYMMFWSCNWMSCLYCLTAEVSPSRRAHHSEVF